ncbi:MAG: HU family DNA-binding protein [Bacteroidales bacterium]
MDHKKFLQALQKRSGLDKNRVNQLLNVTEEVIRHQIIHLNAIDFEGLGRFEPHKRLEFVYKDSHTGRTVLYPPRMAVHFSPDEVLLSEINQGNEHE